MTNQPNNNPKEPVLLLPAGKPPEGPQTPLKNGEKRADDARNPETGQFLPGNQGGPGRPKGTTKKLKVLVDEALAELGAKDAHGNPVSIEKALVNKIVKMALAGDRKMIELIWNYRDGKPSQPLDVLNRNGAIGKRQLSDEEIRRVDDIFAPKDWGDTSTDEDDISYGPINHQPEAQAGAGTSDAGEHTAPADARPGSAPASNA